MRAGEARRRRKRAQSFYLCGKCGIVGKYHDCGGKLFRQSEASGGRSRAPLFGRRRKKNFLRGKIAFLLTNLQEPFIYTGRRACRLFLQPTRRRATYTRGNSRRKCRAPRLNTGLAGGGARARLARRRRFCRFVGKFCDFCENTIFRREHSAAGRREQYSKKIRADVSAFARACFHSSVSPVASGGAAGVKSSKRQSCERGNVLPGAGVFASISFAAAERGRLKLYSLRAAFT